MNATFYARTSTSNRENRAEHRLLEHLKERLGPEALENGQMPTWSALRQASLAMSVECDAEDQSQIERLTKIIENKANQYLNKPNKSRLTSNVVSCSRNVLPMDRTHHMALACIHSQLPQVAAKPFLQLLLRSNMRIRTTCNVLSM